MWHYLQENPNDLPKNRDDKWNRVSVAKLTNNGVKEWFMLI